MNNVVPLFPRSSILSHLLVKQVFLDHLCSSGHSTVMNQSVIDLNLQNPLRFTGTH